MQKIRKVRLPHNALLKDDVSKHMTSLRGAKKNEEAAGL